MKKLLLFVAMFCAAMTTYAQSTAVSGTRVQSSPGTLLASGGWCPWAIGYCVPITNGAFSFPTIASGTRGLVINSGSFTSYNPAISLLYIPSVSMTGASLNWNSFILTAANGTAVGIGAPFIACAVGATYSQTDIVQNWSCNNVAGQPTWQVSFAPPTQPSGSYQNYGNPTFVCTAPCTYTNLAASPIWSTTAAAGQSSNAWQQGKPTTTTNAWTGTGPQSFAGPVAAPNVTTQLTPALDIAWYGALCNGTHDDGPAITAASTAAGSIYATFGTPSNILITKGISGTGNCLVNTGVVYQSGSHFIGSGGTINITSSSVVAFQSGGATSGAAVGDVSDVGFDNLIINQTTAGSLPGIYYLGGTGTGAGTVAPQRHFYVKNSVVHGAGYAIVINIYNQNDGKSHHLSDVQITGNRIYADLVTLATTTATASSGTSTIAVASTTGIGYGDVVAGTGIVGGSIVTSISGLNVGLSIPTIAALSSTAVTFSGIDTLARDGIHLSGDISDFHVDSNNVTNRGDAAIALTSTGGNTYSTFAPGLLARLTPTNGTISDNVCKDDGAGLDFSGGAKVNAVGDVCTATIARVSDPQIRFIYDQYPTPQAINVTGGRFINYYGGGGDSTVVKMDFSGSQVGYGVEPNCFCVVTGAYIGGQTTASSLYFLGANLTLQHNVFDATMQSLAVTSVSGYQTKNITFRDNTWLGTVSLTTNSTAGSIVNSQFINDYINGAVSTFPIQ